MKGIPFYIEQIKTSKGGNVKLQFLGFLIYNIVIMLLSLLVLVRLYSVLNIYYTDIYKMVVTYNFIIALTLCGLCLEEKYTVVRFSADEVDINNLNFIQKLLLL
uniref:Uncharacterized protein n=1 Tax=Ganoderma leucocontextum TaxID=1566825 RepID=A0A2S1WBM3_9APHY|nr:hypothetical protein [Ganoderma leucocontextum]AWJ63949.1 hypothetical protein [Ganoderma leucocontextum]